MHGVPDEELVETYRRASAQRREEIAGELFARHYERVARWCYRLTGEREAAADLAQDVFLKAHRHLDSFKGHSRFSTWLYAIARNEGLNRVRRPRPELEDDEALADLPAMTEGPEEQVARERQSERLMHLLATTLDRTERTVFMLHYRDDMPLDAITRLLRLENASGAKAFIVSARRKLARATQKLRARGEAL